MPEIDYRDLITQIDNEGENLDEWDLDFIESMVRKREDLHYQYSAKEKAKIREVYNKRVPGGSV